MRILLVEDDVHLAAAIRAVCQERGDCDVAAGEDAALACLKQTQYNLALVDHMLDQGSGLSLIRSMRRSHPQIPVLVMTAHASKDFAVACINLGVQRFIEKPFTLHYLKSEIDGLTNAANFVSMGSRLFLRLDRRVVELDGEPLGLTPIEFRIVEFLVSKKGECASRSEITRAIWSDAPVRLNTLDTHLSSVRQKAPELGRRVKLSRGRGYWWDFGA